MPLLRSERGQGPSPGEQRLEPGGVDPFDVLAILERHTDGLLDQIGGPRGRSFGKSRFQQLLRK